MEKRKKRELRDTNLRAWAGETDLFPVHGSLDSSLKKNTAFIKRLRTVINAPNLPTFLQEIRTLSLHKYLSEIISACYEGLCKLKSPGEIAAGVEIVSALHQRFGPADFTRYLGWFLGRGLSTPDKVHLKSLAQDVREKEEKERIARQRVLLRVVTELWLVGVLRSLEDVVRPEDAVKGKENTKTDSTARSKAGVNGIHAENAEAEAFPLEVLKDMLAHDREHVNLPLVVLFVKTFAWDILGVKLLEGRKNVHEDGATTTTDIKAEDSATSEGEEIPSADDSVVTAEMRKRFENIIMRYFEDVKSHIIRDQKLLVTQGRRNAEAYVKSGEIFEDRQANYEKQVKAQEKLITNAQVLADALGAEMPDLKEKDTTGVAADGSIGLVKAGDYLRGQGEGPGIWEDEDERRFYENLIDLKDRVPAILLEDAKKKKAESEEQAAKKPEISHSELSEAKEVAEGQARPLSQDGKPTDKDDQSTAIANKSVGAQVDALLARLPELSNKDMVDELAVDFCFLNSKASRNRMIKAVQEVPKGRSDLLPLYARLVATLGRYMPDILQGLVSYLDEEFRSLQRRKQKDFLGQVRTINVRYLAEMTKFGAVPEHVIFHCLKVSMDDFSRMNIEIICNLLENCGRYLLRNPETAPRMSSFLETLQRKKGAQHLGQQERMLIENATYYVNPPERAAIQQKERTPLDLFLRKIVYVDLTKATLDRIVKQIRKLHWEETEVVALLHKIFTKPGKIKYSNIHLLAVILGSLNRYHQDFTVSVVDDLLEMITLGLELNDFKFNQRRIAEVSYLGELYTYRMVDSPLIFDTMYKIVTFGHDGGLPKVTSINPLDLPDDFFRIRLICNLLEKCGAYFVKGLAKKKLDFFLVFFQYYIFTKEPMPMDIEFLVQDAYALTRPQWKLATNLEEAGNAFAEAVKQNYDQSAVEKPMETEEAEEESLSEDGEDGEEPAARKMEGAKSSGDELDVAADDERQDVDSDSGEEQIVVTRQDDRDPEADADFDREFAKMMTESLDSRKFERKTLFDVPLPMRRAQKETVAATSDDSGGEAPAPAKPQNTMKFALLSKRGNKQMTRSIDVPSDSHFAVAMRTQQQAEREEQQRIKNLVLNLDLRDEQDADGDSQFHITPQRNTNSTEAKPRQGFEKQHGGGQRHDKAGGNRSNQRARKLQLSDVDWYGDRSSSSSPNRPAESGVSAAHRQRTSATRGRRQQRFKC